MKAMILSIPASRERRVGTRAADLRQNKNKQNCARALLSRAPAPPIPLFLVPFCGAARSSRSRCARSSRSCRACACEHPTHLTYGLYCQPLRHTRHVVSFICRLMHHCTIVTSSHAGIVIVISSETGRHSSSGSCAWFIMR